jgi:hypothetical protein
MLQITKIHFHLLLLLFPIAQIAAQPNLPAALEWGKDYNEPSNTVATKVIGITGEGFYLLRQKVLQNASAKPRAWAEFYTKDMKLQRSEEVELKYKGKQRDFEDMIMLGGNLYLLTSFNNTAKKRNYLFKQAIGAKTLTPSKNLDMICETEARNKEVEGTFAFRLSVDSSRLLVFNGLPNEKKNPERFGFRVFDEKFDLIWEKNIVLPYPDNKFTVEEYRVDKEGNVYLLGVLYEDEAKWRRRGNPTYKYVVLSYLDKGETTEEFRIDLDDKFITDLTFRIAPNGTLVFSGFYSDRGTYGIKGTYFVHLNPRDRQVSHRQATPFDFDFLTAFMSEKNREKAREAEMNNDRRRAPELYDYSLDELILRSDGGAVLIAEQFYIEQETYRDYPYGYFPYGYYSPFYYNRFYNNYQTNYFYHYNDIIIVNIRPNGEIEWSARIPKWQETRNDGGYYSSYALSNVRDKLYFIYNDSARNYGGKSNKVYSYGGGEGVIVLSEVNIKGDVTTWPLGTNRDAGVITRPKMCRQIGRREMAVFGERGRGYRFGSLKFE